MEPARIGNRKEREKARGGEDSGDLFEILREGDDEKLRGKVVRNVGRHDVKRSKKHPPGVQKLPFKIRKLFRLIKSNVRSSQHAPF